MTEPFLNIVPKHFTRTEITRIIKHIRIFRAALKNICNTKNCYCHCDFCDFTSIMIPQKTNQPIQYWCEKIRKLWHNQNSGNWLS